MGHSLVAYSQSCVLGWQQTYPILSLVCSKFQFICLGLANWPCLQPTPHGVAAQGHSLVTHSNECVLAWQQISLAESILALEFQFTCLEWPKQVGFCGLIPTFNKSGEVVVGMFMIDVMPMGKSVWNHERS